MRGLSHKCVVTIAFAIALCAHVEGANLKVNCNSSSENTLPTITTALARLNTVGPNTVTVSGACHENIVIHSFDRLTLTANPGASITDASGGAADVISIDDSTRVFLQGFTINGSGGDNAIDCVDSNCSFARNTVQGAASTGVFVSRARVSFSGDVIQDVAGDGMFVGFNASVQADGVTIQRNAGAGINGVSGSLLITNSTVQNNAGNGISVLQNAIAALNHTTVTGNGGHGISVVANSALQVGFFGTPVGSSITANQGAGVFVRDLSFVRFTLGVPNVVKNNLGAADVMCSPQFPATRGALTNIGGGTTNCVEP